MKYGKLVNGKLEYYKPYKGGLLLNGYIIFNPLKSQYIEAGYYPVVEVEGSGNDYIDNNTLIHYISLSENQITLINTKLSNINELIEAMERLIASNGVTQEDKDMASERLILRDTLGKLILTEEGDGSAFNPFKWVEGKSVSTGNWYKTPGDYIWQAIADGIPSSEIDGNYFDIVGL